MSIWLSRRAVFVDEAGRKIIRQRIGEVVRTKAILLVVLARVQNHELDGYVQRAEMLLQPNTGTIATRHLNTYWTQKENVVLRVSASKGSGELLHHCRQILIVQVQAIIIMQIQCFQQQYISNDT